MGFPAAPGPGSLRPAKKKRDEERKSRTSLRDQSKSLKPWRPPSSHTRNNAHRRLAARATQNRSSLQPAALLLSRASSTHRLTHAPPRAHPQPPPQARPPPARSSPAKFPHTAPASHQPSLPGPPRPQRTSVRPPHNSGARPQGPRLTTPTPGFTPGLRLAKPRQTEGETAGEGKQREEAGGGGEQTDGPEAIGSVLPASPTVARRDQIYCIALRYRGYGNLRRVCMCEVGHFQIRG
ncbi:translation initiation factor IF-2 [Mus musculus]|uniref:translation initiation factor IF-2 n=1 Tax=Mus musculus TaxID=10090 RepID=UPI0001552CD2|nr:translation initiation factor IF-2 [Mus musculus]|eukprot:XP_017175346.1 PREDICTED: translation initiation factor IF-2-like [Mus musculus]